MEKRGVLWTVRGWEKAPLVMALCPKGRAGQGQQHCQAPPVAMTRTGPAALEQSELSRNKEQLVFSQFINSLASLLRPQLITAVGWWARGVVVSYVEKNLLDWEKVLRPQDFPENTDFCPKYCLQTL